MHTFHLPCGNCTITLEDVRLQLGLPVDGLVVTGSVQSVDWRLVCLDLLGEVLETIYGGWVEMAWIRKNFAELVEDSIEVQRERYAWAYILQIIKGIMMPDKSRNLVHLRWLLKLVYFRGADKLSWVSSMLAMLYREMC
ncbi:hypothetical protein PVK06_023749 [Gossypium arboreum]|uniref:Aminotransferase-like plant mobile domain-containing protein n=1 Tax=Gossypium arboreum TaxID=29729 RepID=A0ABR0PCG3_GOSAR|nr:hypothetical protein PVK06_023749 [Gossypium arboreum]